MKNLSLIICFFMVLSCNSAKSPTEEADNETNVSKPTKEVILEVIKSESVFSRYKDHFVINSVDLKSSKLDKDKYQALITINYTYNRRSDLWGSEGIKDPIPHLTKVKNGSNELQTTCLLVRYDDGSWHLEGFIK